MARDVCQLFETAAGFAATAAVMLAGTMVVGPGVSFDQGSTVSNP